MAENPNWENDDSLFIKALLCGMHRDSIAFVVETEKEPKIGRLLLQKSFASCVCCYRPASSSYRQFDNVALLPLQPPKVLQSRSLTSQSCRTHARSSSRGEKKETKEVPPFRRLIARALLLLLIFFIIWFFFLRLLFLAIITNRQRESPWQRFDDVYAQLLRWQSNIGYGLGDWVSVGIYLSLKCLCVYFFFLYSLLISFFRRLRVADGVFFYVTFFIRVFVYSFCSSLYSYCRGTHGYMAPEVLSKGTAYDSSADWFSFGCMLYKLLKGHSPFRQHKTKDKHEIDRMTLTMVLYPPYTLCI